MNRFAHLLHTDWPTCAAAPVAVFLAAVLAIPAAGQAPDARMVEVDGHAFRVMTAGFEHLERGVPVVVLEALEARR